MRVPSTKCETVVEVGMTFVVSRAFPARIGGTNERGDPWITFEIGDIFTVVGEVNIRDSILKIVLHPVHGLCTRITGFDGLCSTAWDIYVRPVA